MVGCGAFPANPEAYVPGRTEMTSPRGAAAVASRMVEKSASPRPSTYLSAADMGSVI